MFKGQFRSILATIRDQSHLNIIAIESRTHGDHDELEILLQKCVISSRFNQKLSYKERTSIYKDFNEKNVVRPIHYRSFGGFGGPRSYGADSTPP